MSEQGEASGLPHRAVLFLHGEVHPLNPLGECVADRVARLDPVIFSVDGDGVEGAKERLNALLAHLRMAYREFSEGRGAAT